MPRCSDTHLVIKPVATGTGPPVFIFEFTEVGVARRLSATLAQQHGDRAIYAIDPVTDIARTPDYVPLRDLAEQYALQMDELHDGQPFVVVGYCAASALATHVAKFLRTRRTVRTVLVQPSAPDLSALATQFERIRLNLTVSSDHVPADLDMSAPPQDIYRHMDQALRRDELAWAERKGVSPKSPALALMAGRHRAWMSILLSTQEDMATAEPYEFNDTDIVHGNGQLIGWPAAQCDPRRIFGLNVRAEDLQECAELMGIIVANGDSQ